MAHTAFEQEIVIQAPPEKVRSFLGTLENHPKIHPMIVAIRLLDTTTKSDGVPIRHYAIRDQMRVGPFTTKFTYRVSLQVNQAGEILFDAIQFPRIRLLNTTRCLPEGTGTRVIEQVNIQAPRLLIKTVFQQAKQSHQQLLLNLKKQLEEQGG